VRPVLYLWLNAPTKHYSPSLRHVFDWIAYCNFALFMMNSTLNPTCVDKGSVNEYVYVCMHVFYLAPQSSVPAGCPAFVLTMKDSWNTPLCLVSVSCFHARVLTLIQSRPSGSTPSSTQALLRNEVIIYVKYTRFLYQLDLIMFQN
jgi:hypothetical protein